jgi:RNA polymerase sigma factor (sigma-70 family)
VSAENGSPAPSKVAGTNENPRLPTRGAKKPLKAGRGTLPLYLPLPPAYRGVMADSLDAWFKREILVHEGALLRYLNRIWRQREEVPDLRQEIYARVYEAATKSRPHSAKSFLFTTARHLIADRIRRGRIVSIEAVGDSEALNVLVDELTPERQLSAWQDMRRVTQALNRLPPRCREVVWLRKVDELSTREVAVRLGISERTVEGQILKGMRLMSDMLLGEDPSTMQVGSEMKGEIEDEHGEP